jgi:cytochrome c oxidase subunit 4
MAERAFSPATYIVVLAVLLVLTFLTVGASFADIGGAGHIIVGMTIGVIKASLVVLFFMHALHSSKVTWVVIAAAVFWVLLLLSLTLTDYFTRGLLPYYGH